MLASPTRISIYDRERGAYLDNRLRVVSARQKLRLYGPRGFGLPTVLVTAQIVEVV